LGRGWKQAQAARARHDSILPDLRFFPQIRIMKAILLILPLLCALVLPVLAKDGELPSPEETVRKLYEDHLKDDSAFSKGRKNGDWEFRFGEALLVALRSENWSFDPLLFAQDHDVKKVDVRLIDSDPKGNSLVLVSFVNFGEPMRVIVALQATDHAHRIENIINPANGSSVSRDLAFEAD